MRLPTFATLEDEVQFLRGLLSAQRLADEILEDCLQRQLGLTAAVDVFLSQCARMLHAEAGFVELSGAQGRVLARAVGNDEVDLEVLAQVNGATPGPRGCTWWVAPLALGEDRLGALGLLLRTEPQAEGPAHAFVVALAEALDSALLGFLTLADGRSAREHLDGLSEQPAFRPRARFGPYALVAPLGTGGMAQVLVARREGPSGVGRLVALKRMLPHVAGDEALVSQFLEEARLGMRLSHPNLVTFHDFGQLPGGTYYLAMELVRGVELARLLHPANGRLPSPLVGAVLTQLLDGLHAFHELQDEEGAPLHAVHRDLSPQNVMVGYDGRVRLLDFGVAKARNQRTFTVPGIVKGKPLYMSPEQARGERLDRRSDLFSVGLMAYELLTGEQPFARATVLATMEAIVSTSLARPPSMPLELWEVLERVLGKRPDDRPRTAHALATQLREVLPPWTGPELSRWLHAEHPGPWEHFSRWERLATP